MAMTTTTMTTLMAMQKAMIMDTAMITATITDMVVITMFTPAVNAACWLRSR